MLGLFSKKAMILGAPAAGQLLDITQVNDPFFASKNLGDGVAVIPQSQTVCAPCDGRLVMVFETRHAFGIRSGEVEVLVHIGIDTVDMDGEGFAVSWLKASGSRRESHWPPWISAKSRRPGTALWWW